MSGSVWHGGLVSCKEEHDIEHETTKSAISKTYQEFEYGEVDEYHIQEIDGCEYILVNGQQNHEPALTHKGNCKYCIERTKNKEFGLETIEE